MKRRSRFAMDLVSSFDLCAIKILELSLTLRRVLSTMTPTMVLSSARHATLMKRTKNIMVAGLASTTAQTGPLAHLSPVRTWNNDNSALGTVPQYSEPRHVDPVKSSWERSSSLVAIVKAVALIQRTSISSSVTQITDFIVSWMPAMISHSSRMPRIDCSFFTNLAKCITRKALTTFKPELTPLRMRKKSKILHETSERSKMRK
mmetsp:Transcript_129903/g.416880  ORF Transcript_129903/g.416880 Transcript_129903/m.416880 type:complete len:204 (+) Transcript_129903:921-1532(+)